MTEKLTPEIGLKPETKKLVSIEESKELARQLLARHESQIRENACKDVDGWGEPYTEYQDSTRHFLEMIPEDIREHYQGHGITRNSELDRLTAVLNIMANQAIKGWSGSLVGDYKAFQIRTEFLVISKKDKPLPRQQEKVGELELIYNEMKQWEADIGAIVVNTKYYPLVDDLKEMFPTVNIIKANEIEGYFEIKG